MMVTACTQIVGPARTFRDYELKASSTASSALSAVRTAQLVKKLLGVALGILTAIGGFMDIGDIVANAATGARFGMSLAWAVLLGIGGIVVYAEMAGRVAAVAGRPTFDLVRERLGARV